MCPCNASVLRDGQVYVPADVVQLNKVNSKAKRDFRVNPCLLSSNKCRPHLSTYITRRGRQEGSVLVHDHELQGGGQMWPNTKLFLERREQASSRFHIK